LSALEQVSATRWRVLAGIAGPAAFVSAWALLGASRDGYSPVGDPISRLAAVGADTRPLMTAGMVTFGVCVAFHGPALRRHHGRGAAAAASITAGATVAVAAMPLEGWGGSTGHAAAAFVAYGALAGVPAAAAPGLARRGQRAAAAVSLAAAGLVVSALAASVIVDGGSGLWQRVGLTAGDVWLACSAATMLRRPARPGPEDRQRRRGSGVSG